MDIDKLVFIDETWASTNMTRNYGRAPKGRRCIASAPLGNWQTTTFVAGLLCPTLRPGDIAILDNLSSHKVEGVKEAITAVGASVLYLPPYSPDLNPIEKLFSKLKTLLRKAAKRSLDELWTEIGELLNTVSKSECQNYLASSGYVST